MDVYVETTHRKDSLMEDIIADARSLGKKIASHPRMTAFMAAARAVSEDKEAQETLKAYQTQMERIQEWKAPANQSRWPTSGSWRSAKRPWRATTSSRK